MKNFIFCVKWNGSISEKRVNASDVYLGMIHYSEFKNIFVWLLSNAKLSLLLHYGIWNENYLQMLEVVYLKPETDFIQNEISFGHENKSFCITFYCVGNEMKFRFGGGRSEMARLQICKF